MAIVLAVVFAFLLLRAFMLSSLLLLVAGVPAIACFTSVACVPAVVGVYGVPDAFTVAGLSHIVFGVPAVAGVLTVTIVPADPRVPV